MDFGIGREALSCGVDFLHEFRAQPRNLGLIPDRGFHRICISGSKDFYAEVHFIAASVLAA